MRAIILLVSAIVLGLAGGYAWSKWSSPAAAHAVAAGSAGPQQTAKELEATVYFDSCQQAQAAGKAPMLQGRPGYRAELDPDGDGVACPPPPAG